MKVHAGWLRVLAVAAAAGVLLVAHYTGLLELATHPDQLRQAIASRGAVGAAAFVATYAVLQPLGVPGTVFILVAPLVWPWPQAYTVSMVGTMLASINGFLFARFVARDWLAARMPRRFSAYNDALERHAFATVAALRFVFWMPQALHTFFGISGVSFGAHFWGSLVGYALPLFLVAYYGEALFAFLQSVPLFVWGLTTLVLLVAGVFMLRFRRRRAAS